MTGSVVADKAISEFSSALALPLVQAVSLVPLTREFVAELQSHGRPASAFEFEDLPALAAGATDWAERISLLEPIAFIEAEFFGGLGTQAAIGWQAGKVAVGPLQSRDAINQVLRWLGIKPAGLMDEFDTVQLGRYRDTQSWVKG